MDEFYEWKDGAIDAQEFIRSGISVKNTIQSG